MFLLVSMDIITAIMKIEYQRFMKKDECQTQL